LEEWSEFDSEFTCEPLSEQSELDTAFERRRIDQVVPDVAYVL